MLKYEITFRVSLCSTCMHAGDGCETPHNDSFKPKWHLKVIFSFKQNACHKLLWNLSFHGFLYRQLEPERVLSLTDRCDSSIIIQQHKVEYNNARLEYSHPPMLHGYLESWLFGQLVILYCKKTLFDQSAERATFLYSLCFSRLMRNEHRNLAEKRASPSLNIQEEEASMHKLSTATHICEQNSIGEKFTEKSVV